MLEFFYNWLYSEKLLMFTFFFKCHKWISCEATERRFPALTDERVGALTLFWQANFRRHHNQPKPVKYFTPVSADLAEPMKLEGIIPPERCCRSQTQILVNQINSGRQSEHLLPGGEAQRCADTRERSVTLRSARLFLREGLIWF